MDPNNSVIKRLRCTNDDVIKVFQSLQNVVHHGGSLNFDAANTQFIYKISKC